MKLQVINVKGEKTENIEVSDKIFSVKPSENLIQSIVDWQLNHFKARTAKTKQRNEIKGSTAKIYAQKGTGGARHSSRKAPIFVGGGVAHGPKGELSYKKRKLNKSEKKLSIASLITEKMKSNNLIVFNDFNEEIKNLCNDLVKKEKVNHKDLFYMRENNIYFYSNGWNYKAIYALLIGFIFSFSILWNYSLQDIKTFSWIIGSLVSFVIYYLLNNE